MKEKILKSFMEDRPAKLAALTLFLNEHDHGMNGFTYSFIEIDRIAELIRKNIKREEVLKAFEVYLGEAVIHWGGGEWTYYESKSASMSKYNKRFGITKIESGEYKGYVPDYVPSWTIENRIISNEILKPVSDAIDSKTSGSKKRMK